MKTYRLKTDTEWDITRYKKAIENHREVDAFLFQIELLIF